MSMTVHVIPKDGRWAVKREGGSSARVFSTPKEAIKIARVIAREELPGQLVVHGLDGRIKEYNTYGITPIKDPPGKKSAKIEKAIGQITRDRLNADPIPSRG